MFPEHGVNHPLRHAQDYGESDGAPHGDHAGGARAGSNHRPGGSVWALVVGRIRVGASSRDYWFTWELRRAKDGSDEWERVLL